ncbi:hypothetical protein DS742_02545 [Lacrimispora amygdalina]|uniref:Uncharacterized protein n=2 Tax=Lacrimispora amygdalina TaxID=253257 RepID=A0A3E2NHP0_9FIRM|nr:hypothetical protein DS742_02545 [Clostridium indicum]
MALHPFEHEVIFNDPRNKAMDSTSTTGWKVTKKKGSLSGVGVSVSGAGAYAEMSGNFSFTLKHMESSRKYNKMVNDYKISGGVSGFWSWLTFGANASTHKEEIQEALKEMSSSEEVNGTVEVKLMVTGLYPNVQVDASAYVLVLQITDDQGSTATVFSDTAPKNDVGAQDENYNNLPVKDNESTIVL